MHSNNIFLEELKNPPKEFRPVAFWFLNHSLQETEMARQIKEMKEKGFGGIMLHARIGLRSGYLNAEWHSIIDFCLKEAARHDLDVWLYDELNYPSGPAGGKLFEKFPDCSMQCLKPVYESILSSDEEIKIPVGENTCYVFAVSTDGNIKNLLDSGVNHNSITWKNHDITPVSIIVLDQCEDLSIYNKFPDYFDKEAMQEFVHLSYDWYAERFSPYFGTVIKGEFTDNSCASFGYIRRSVPWSINFPERFERRTGKQLNNILPGVFLDIPQSRSDRIIFWRFINDEYLDSFIKPVDDSCRKHGIVSTGHYCIEDGDSEHIRQLGDRFIQKRNQGLPAVDMLGKSNLSEMADLLRMKNRDTLSISIPGTSCPAYFSKASRTMCECLGLAGKWNLTLAEIKRITGLLVVLGIDLFVPHGIYYSIATHRKWEAIPDHFHNPLWMHYREWTDWIAKLCYLTSHCERISQTALLYPASSQQANMTLSEHRDGIKHCGTTCAAIDMTYRSAGNFLLENNIPYEIIDETYIQEAVIDNGNLVLTAANGKAMSFAILLLPHASVLENQTYQKLQEWQKSGGKVIALNSLTQCLFNPYNGEITTVSTENCFDLEIKFSNESELQGQAAELLDFINTYTSSIIHIEGSNGKIVTKEWKKNGITFCLLHNISRNEIKNVKILYRNDNNPYILDLDTAELIDVAKQNNDGTYQLIHDFHAAESMVLVSGPGLTCLPRKVKQGNCREVLTFEGPWKFITNQHNVLPLRECNIEAVTNTHTAIYKFCICDIPQNIGLALDEEMLDCELKHGCFFNRIQCYLNGKRIEKFTPGNVFDSWIVEADITSFIQAGENELQIVKKASLPDFRGDSPLLFGNFALKNNSLIKPETELYHGDWASKGYPYYAGSASYSKTITLPKNFRGRSLELNIGQPGNSAEIWINEQKLAVLIAPPWSVNISKFNQENVLHLTIIIANTAANIWGGTTTASGLLDTIKIIAYQ